MSAIKVFGPIRRLDFEPIRTSQISSDLQRLTALNRKVPTVLNKNFMSYRFTMLESEPTGMLYLNKPPGTVIDLINCAGWEC